jgi:hypothetical protein
MLFTVKRDAVVVCGVRIERAPDRHGAEWTWCVSLPEAHRAAIEDRILSGAEHGVLRTLLHLPQCKPLAVKYRWGF